MARRRNRRRNLGQAANRGSRCVRFKTVTDKRGKRVRRCAKFSGAGRGLRGLVSRCVRYQQLPSGAVRCAQFAPVEGPDEVLPDQRARSRFYREIGGEAPPITEEGVVVKSGSRIRRRAMRQEDSAQVLVPRRSRLPAALPRRLRPRVRRAAS